MTTLDYFNATRGIDLRSKAGCLTLAQAAELMDAIGCVYVCCSHAFGGNAPEHFAKPLEQIQQASKLSIARARSVLALWQRWTHQCHGVAPDLSAVQGFIWALRD